MASPSLSKELGLDNKLGVLFIGTVIASAIYGITCLQTFIYHRSGSNDKLLFKFTIYFLWLLDTLQLAFVAHAMYYYLVTNYGNPLSLISPAWSILAQVCLSTISDLIIRSIFAKRVYIITKGNKILLTVIIIATLVHTVTGLAFASKSFQHRTFAYFPTISWLMYTALANGTAADILTAATLCIALSRSRTGFQRTDNIVNTLVLYAVNSCVLTSLAATGTLMTYAIWPDEFIFMAIFFSQNKLFFNSLLSTLNSRKSLREKVSGVSDIALGLSGTQISSSGRTHVGMTSKGAYMSPGQPEPHDL